MLDEQRPPLCRFCGNRHWSSLCSNTVAGGAQRACPVEAGCPVCDGYAELANKVFAQSQAMVDAKVAEAVERCQIEIANVVAERNAERDEAARQYAQLEARYTALVKAIVDERQLDDVERERCSELRKVLVAVQAYLRTGQWEEPDGVDNTITAAIRKGE